MGAAFPPFFEEMHHEGTLDAFMASVRQGLAGAQEQLAEVTAHPMLGIVERERENVAGYERLLATTEAYVATLT